MTDILTGYNTRTTPQTSPAHPSQTQNAANGYTFTVSALERLKRFLVLGTDSGTYYASPKNITKSNADNIVRLAQTDHKAAVVTVVNVSLRGAAPRQNPTLFALAVLSAHGTTDERAYALAQLPKVARTGTHLFLFARYVEQFRGWGPALKKAVGGWYTAKDADKVAYQSVKYAQREGWSHRDLLRLSRPSTLDPALNSTFRWIVRGATDEHTPALIEGFVKARAATGPQDVAAMVRQYGLTWEMLPDFALSSTVVWDALLDNGMGQTALMRQLPRLTRLGVLGTMGQGRTAEVAARLVDMERLRTARVHPVSVLIAQRTYASGAGKGSSWVPVTDIVDALDMAFYNAFGAVEPTGKRHMLALDVSGSMGWSPIPGAGLTARDASAALALVTMSVEKHTEVVGFTGKLTKLNISPRQRLDDVIETITGLPFGPTDASLPMRHALETKTPVDTFVIYTDNETWYGPEHAHQSLEKYRQTTGIPAKLVVVGMTATECTIADPNDAGSLNVAGFDSGLPQFISDFSAGL